MAANLATRHASLGETVRALRAVSPEATLQRGYAIVTAEDGVIARDARNFERGDKVTAQLARGRLALTVDAVEETAAAEKSGDPSEEPPAAR
jgi:exodeoxyribonuclease VII large subunit